MDNSVLSSVSELMQGMLIRGKYEILDKIGAGGMATVYRARHVAFDEIRAIKVVRSFLAEDEAFIRRLRSEAIISRKLKHPNAVRVDDLDQLEDGRPFIVMEYVEGPDLRKVIRDTGPLPAVRAVNIAVQVVSALIEAHRLGIIHRDIKPDNIVLVSQPGDEELVKVLDFGIAKLHTASTSGTAATQTGMLLCTPEYASPEQVSGGSRRIDGRSDIYSLGMVMYEMLTGEVPFHSDTPMGILLAQMNVVPKSPTEFKPELGIPQELSALLMKAVEKDPADRFQTADEMLQALRAIRLTAASDDSATGASGRGPLGGVVPITQELEQVQSPLHADTSAQYLTAELEESRRRRRRRVRIGLAMATLLIAGLIAVLQWKPGVFHTHFRPHREPPPATTIDQSALDRVVAAFRDAHQAGIEKITPTVGEGVVHLGGEAPGSESVDAAAEIAAKATGYVVDKNVRIVPAPSTPAAPPAAVAPPERPPASPAPAILSAEKPASNDVGNTTNPMVPTIGGTGSITRRQAVPADSAPIEQRSPERSAPLHVDPRVRALLASAREKFDHGHLEEALSDYGAVLKIDPHNREAQRGRAQVVSARDYVKKLDAEQ